MPRGGRAPRGSRLPGRRGAGGRGAERLDAGGDRARPGQRHRGGDRRVLPARRLRGHGGGSGGGVLARDRARPRPSGGLQVIAAGALGPARRDRQLCRHRRARPAARPHLRGARLGRRAPCGTGSGRSKKHAEQEAARTALEMLYSADEDEFEIVAPLATSDAHRRTPITARRRPRSGLCQGHTTLPAPLQAGLKSVPGAMHLKASDFSARPASPRVRSWAPTARASPT